MIDAGIIGPDLVITDRDFLRADLADWEAARNLAATHVPLPNVEIFDEQAAGGRRILVRHRRPSITTIPPKEPR